MLTNAQSYMEVVMLLWEGVLPDGEGRVLIERPKDERPGYCRCGCGATTNVAPATRPGYRKGDHYRYLQGHQKRAEQALEWTVEDRGYETPCWIWRGEVGKNGYGRTSFFGSRDTVHRRMLEQVRGGLIPARMHTDHLCEQPLCCNPDHLEVVPPHINARRGRSGRLSEAQYEELEGMSRSLSAWDFAARAELLGIRPETAFGLVIRARRRHDQLSKETV